MAYFIIWRSGGFSLTRFISLTIPLQFAWIFRFDVQLKNKLPGLFPGDWSLLWTELLKTGRVFFSYGRKNSLTTRVDYLGLWASVPGFQAHTHTHTHTEMFWKSFLFFTYLEHGSPCQWSWDELSVNKWKYLFIRDCLSFSGPSFKASTVFWKSYSDHTPKQRIIWFRVGKAEATVLVWGHFRTLIFW